MSNRGCGARLGMDYFRREPLMCRADRETSSQPVPEIIPPSRENPQARDLSLHAFDPSSHHLI